MSYKLGDFSLQWGRGLTSAEIKEAKGGFEKIPIGFNGAADLHPRKFGPLRKSLSCRWIASMGPRTYIRGNFLIHEQTYYPKLFASMGPRTYIRGNSFNNDIEPLACCFFQW